MKFTLILVAIAFLATTHSSVYDSIKEDVLSYFSRSNRKPRFEIRTNNEGGIKVKTPKSNLHQKVMKLKEISKKNYETQKKKDLEFMKEIAKEKERRIDDTKTFRKESYQFDPVLNFLKRRDFRRRYSDSDDTDTSVSSSSSMELQDWKDEWREHWTKVKFEALNHSDPKGDEVNMVAARPWGVPCGDPNQHDMPWGTCMLPMECEAEYRIYRGDNFCGRTQFICCAIQLTNYDMYQGFDVSFDDSELSTDSEEERNRNRGSKERSKRKRQKEKKRRKRDRKTRKRKIKRNIRKIIREIRKILNKSYRNGTAMRKKKTKQLKKFVKQLKKQYKKDSESVKNIHEEELIIIDVALQKKLNQIRNLNQNFMKNATFRNIILNGTTNQRGARMLVQAYPDLAQYFADKTRRNLRRHDDYDIEYGLFYE